MMLVTCGNTEAELIEKEGVLFVSSLKGDGNVNNFIQLLKDVSNMSKVTPVFISVDVNTPKFEKLMKVYMRYGAVPTHVLLKVGE